MVWYGMVWYVERYVCLFVVCYEKKQKAGVVL